MAQIQLGVFKCAKYKQVSPPFKSVTLLCSFVTGFAHSQTYSKQNITIVITDAGPTALGGAQELELSKEFPSTSTAAIDIFEQAKLGGNTGRILNERLMDYEFVIAHYNENLDWLTPIANHTHVYHKGKDPQPPPLPLYAWDRLSNVGRESHTYLYHIINNYETLPEITVFLQGDGQELADNLCFRNPMKYVYNVKKNITCKVHRRLNNWGRINHYGKWLKMLNSGVIRRANMTLGEFFEELFGYPHPRDFPSCPRGCFAGTREMIKKHPIDFYRKAISFVDDHPNPEEGHYFERLWATIIS